MGNRALGVAITAKKIRERRKMAGDTQKGLAYFQHAKKAEREREKAEKRGERFKKEDYFAVQA